jgi:hypothetical protein
MADGSTPIMAHNFFLLERLEIFVNSVQDVKVPIEGWSVPKIEEG